MMSAWGTGMQQNDVALDAISEAEHVILTVKSTEEIINRMKDLWSGVSRHCYRWSMLGLADLLMDRGQDLSEFKDELTVLAREELSEEELKHWDREREEREESIENFVRKINGEEFDTTDNKSLLDKIAETFSERGK
jgi:hypothetical protein